MGKHTAYEVVCYVGRQDINSDPTTPISMLRIIEIVELRQANFKWMSTDQLNPTSAIFSTPSLNMYLASEHILGFKCAKKLIKAGASINPLFTTV